MFTLKPSTLTTSLLSTTLRSTEVKADNRIFVWCRSAITKRSTGSMGKPVQPKSIAPPSINTIERKRPTGIETARMPLTLGQKLKGF